MTPLLDQAVAEVQKLSPSQQEDFARWMLAELANMRQWNFAAEQAADAMLWYEESLQNDAVGAD
ncbi:MAG: hypothetical protein GC204_20755 [Chloroflexi bacterium]|nr:hypothetical protein [Chloroflexota bacterium]